MTIRSHLNPQKLNEKLQFLEACAENAPAGTYEDAKALRRLIGASVDNLIRDLKAAGYDTPNCDQAREVEAVIYGYVRDANPLEVATAEGFGEAMSGPAAERVISQATRDRDALAALAGSE